jgi:ACR3 family arsenite efflux pump ArsB
MTSQHIFGIFAMFYAVANLASMGLELDLRETLKSLRSAKIIVLTLFLSWVVGPALGLLLTKVLPLTEAHRVQKPPLSSRAEGQLRVMNRPSAPFHAKSVMRR